MIARNRNGGGRQSLTFEISVANLDFAKRVEVHWEGEDSEWRMLPAAYVGPHVEHILAKLGVENRCAAARCASEVLFG